MKARGRSNNGNIVKEIEIQIQQYTIVIYLTLRLSGLFCNENEKEKGETSFQKKIKLNKSPLAKLMFSLIKI